MGNVNWLLNFFTLLDLFLLLILVIIILFKHEALFAAVNRVEQKQDNLTQLFNNSIMVTDGKY